MKNGDYVHYSPKIGKKQNGRIKSFNENYAFVVYKCGNEWDKYQNFTGENTNLDDLKKGWVDENGKILSEYCDHEFIYTNFKYQPINQKICIYCDKIIE